MRKKLIMLCAVFLLLSTSRALADGVGFKDIAPDYWAKTAIEELQKLGIVGGYADQTFKPDNVITRAEAAQMIYNEHQSVENDLKTAIAAAAQNKAAGSDGSSDSEVTTAIANTLPGVVVIKAGNKLGAGFFIDSRHVMTAEHVIDGSKTVKVSTLAGNNYTGTVLASDVDKDLAVLEVVAGNEQVKPLAFAESYNVGQTAIAIGHPDGLAYSVSKGIVSYTGRELDGTDDKLIQVDTAISPGNSGGPLIDLNGSVIGIVDQKINANATEGLGFAISMEDMKAFLKSSGIQ